jgi:hypothetical protein
VSVQPVIEMASSAHDDDHQDLTFRQAESLGVALEVHDRQSELVDEEWPRHPDSCREVGEGRDPPSSIRLPDRTIPDQRL